MGFVKNTVRAVASIFTPSAPSRPQPSVREVPTITTPVSEQAARQDDSERRIAAISGQPNLTNVISQQNDEDETGSRARRRTLGV